LNAGESTPKFSSGEISSIILSAQPALIALEASSTVHHPGRLQ
jgi:hypothetical protein